MGTGTAIAFASLLLTMVVGFGTTMRSIGRLEQKFDLMWDWYCRETGAAREGGQRHYDPPATLPRGRGRAAHDDDSTTG